MPLKMIIRWSRSHLLCVENNHRGREGSTTPPSPSKQVAAHDHWANKSPLTTQKHDPPHTQRLEAEQSELGTIQLTQPSPQVREKNITKVTSAHKNTQRTITDSDHKKPSLTQHIAPFTPKANKIKWGSQS